MNGLSKYLSVITLLILLLLPISTSYADEESELIGFSYEVIQPENQKNSQVGYFDLEMATAQEQTVLIRLNNTSQKSIEIQVDLNAAKTNSNGVIEYGPNTIPNDESLQHDFSAIVTGPERITLPPESQEELQLLIKMPSRPVSGLIAGGIQLQEISDENEETTDNGMIVNKFAYLIGMILSQGEEELEENLELKDVFPELKNSRNAFLVNFSNTQGEFVENMTVMVGISHDTLGDVTYETKKSQLRMAPNSQIFFPVLLNGEAMVPGKYHSRILVTTDAGGTWEWEKEFTISESDARKFNEQDVSLIIDQGLSTRMLIVIFISLLIVSGVLYIVIKESYKDLKRQKARQRKISSID